MGLTCCFEGMLQQAGSATKVRGAVADVMRIEDEPRVICHGLSDELEDVSRTDQAII